MEKIGVDGELFEHVFCSYLITEHNIDLKKELLNEKNEKNTIDNSITQPKQKGNIHGT